MKNKVIKIKDEFWLHYRELIRTEMIPYQWNVLNDTIQITIERERDDDAIPNKKSHAIENFKIAAGITKGRHYGWVFQDSDVYKWLEAVAYSLEEKTDPELKKTADYVVDLIGQAQEDSGYLSTYFTIEAPERKFRCLGESHELYCAGHFLEAAVAYYETTGNQQVLKIACKLADYLDTYFGEEKGKHFGFDGHEEIEIGLMRLYHLTGEKRYLQLSRYFLYARGIKPDFFQIQREEEPNYSILIKGMERWPQSYYQNHKPILEQDTAEGHAVRLVYMCTAMADVAATLKDQSLFEACKNIWRNIVDKRMYITGGIGSTYLGESFTFDYDLPNDTMYCETCASVGLIFFARQMLKNEIKSEYADVMERALYNTVLAGMALDGKHFFYVNPLEVYPQSSKKDPGKSHVKCERPQWLGCACCPPNLARLLASLNQYIYIQKYDTIYVNLYMSCEGILDTENGRVRIQQVTNYPWEGCIKLNVNSLIEKEVTIALRIPEWSDTYKLCINGEMLDAVKEDGYVRIQKIFKEDEIILDLDMSIEKWIANTAVREDICKIAISRGPIVYCIEEIDNGENLHMLSLDDKTEFEYEYRKNELGGIGIIIGNGYKEEIDESGALYRKNRGNERKRSEKRIKWIPYYAWANRGENEMQVWIHQR